MNELQPLSQIFQKRLFRIPDYQRGYAWQDQQLRDFWEDIINLQPDRYHYTGLLSLKVLNKAESQNLGSDDKWLLQSGYKAYHIVDGQQRMTTFIIMLNEIVELVCHLSENEGKAEDEMLLGYETIKDIQAQYISKKRPPDGLIITYMFGYENDNPSAEYMKYRILGQPFGGTIKETYYTKNLQYAKEFFARELAAFYEVKGIEGLTELYRKLTQQLMFNIHEIEDDYDVFVAFETMNNRGKKLTNLELLKNRLIYLTTLYPKNILDEANEAALRDLINKAWREIYYQLGRNESDLLSDNEFLRAHWIMYYSYSRKRGDDYIKFLLRKFSHKSIFENVLQPVTEENVDFDDAADLDQDDYEDLEPAAEFPEPISGEFLQPKEIMDYVNSLNETAEYWYYTFYPDDCTLLSDEEKVWLEKLKHVGMGYFRPMIAVSMIPRLGFTKEERLSLYKAIERFIFVAFRMAMYQSSYKSSDYNRKTRELYFGNLGIADITADLKATTDADAKGAIRVFVTRMNRRFDSADGFYGWYNLRYFLYEYEYSLATKYKLEKLSWALLNKVVKDKITIEHILPQTPTKLYWRNAFRQYTPDEIKTLSASLGNMLPLSQSINSSLQNDSFDDKKARGYVNGCHCEVEVSKEMVWDAEHIYDRGMKLLHFMESRWNIQFESKALMEELLHVTFVHDGREIPPELKEEKKETTPATPVENNAHSNEANWSEAPDSWGGVRRRYWAYALPIIKDAQGPEGSFRKVTTSKEYWINGSIGISGFYLTCEAKANAAAVCLSLTNSDREKNKSAFDYLASQKPEIEGRLGAELKWWRLDNKKASYISFYGGGMSINDEATWNQMAEFHAKWSKKFYDIFVPMLKDWNASRK